MSLLFIGIVMYRNDCGTNTRLDVIYLEKVEYNIIYHVDDVTYTR